MASKQIKKREIVKLLNDLEQRQERKKSIALRIFMWDFTTKASIFLKRFFDVILSFLALVFLLPLFIVIAILIKLSSKGPIIFKQVRVGQYGENFNFYKFRTMRQGADKLKEQLENQNESSDGVIFKMKDDPRITKIGKILRRTSLDEFPQFFNVFIGDMSLVGPRPPVPREVRMYTLEERKRLNVRPGLTCTWQISGRSDIPFNQQVMLDKDYIASKSLWSDLMILFKTVPAILTGKGAY